MQYITEKEKIKAACRRVSEALYKSYTILTPGLSSIAYTLCSNQPTYLPKFANLNFLENTTPSATLKNVILRF